MLTTKNEACLRMRYRFRFYHLQREREHLRSQMDNNFMTWLICSDNNGEITQKSTWTTHK